MSAPANLQIAWQRAPVCRPLSAMPRPVPQHQVMLQPQAFTAGQVPYGRRRRSVQPHVNVVPDRRCPPSSGEQAHDI